MKRILINSGITFSSKENKFTFDFDNFQSDEIISMTDIALKKSEIFSHTYLYGYEFKSEVPSNIRTEFIHQIKGLSSTKINEVDFKRFLVRPILELKQQIYDIDTIIYPLSQRSEINKIIVKYIREYSLVDSRSIYSFELVKSLANNIKFDFDAFKIDYGDNDNFFKLKKQANKIIKRINNSNEYFSLAKFVPSKYRPYIIDYLNFNKEELNLVKEHLQNKTILLVDDINTTNSTIKYCLRQIKRISIPKKIIIFTVLGKSYFGL